MRRAARLAALSGYKVAFVWSHDSVGLGEDGPTHQPIEQLAAMRGDARPPADPPGRRQRDRAGVAGPHRRRRPDRDHPHPPEGAGARGHRRARAPRASPQGAYVLVDEPHGDLDLVLIGTGSEVSAVRRRARRCSRPRASRRARRVDAVVGPVRRAAATSTAPTVLPPGVPDARGRGRRARFGWERYADDVVGIDHFGASAPGRRCSREFGFTPENVAERAPRALLAPRTTGDDP